jgi:Uma2 family endonuclease
VATTTTKLMTFAEFEQLPNPSEGFRLELRHGELFQLPPAKWNHFLLQDRLRALLQNAAAETGKAATEFGFRPTQENEYLIADVAVASIERWKSADPKGYFSGAPEIVIEVLSPSNTATEMLDKEKLCLENGCQEFWIVDPTLQLVKVSTPDGRAITYSAGQEIPLFFGGRLAVDSIFATAEG